MHLHVHVNVHVCHCVIHDTIDTFYTGHGLYLKLAKCLYIHVVHKWCYSWFDSHQFFF